MQNPKITPNHKSIRVFSAFVDIAALNLSVWCAFTALVLNRPNYGSFKLFCCFVGISLAALITWFLVHAAKKSIIKNSINFDDPERENTYLKIAGKPSPRVDWIAKATVLVGFCVVLDQLARAGKFDKALTDKAIMFVGIMTAIVLILGIGNLFTGENKEVVTLDNLQLGESFTFALVWKARLQGVRSEDLPQQQLPLRAELSTINSVVAALRMPSVAH